MKALFPSAVALLFSLPLLSAPRFSISFPASQSATPIDGRLLLVVSTDPSAEPRMEVNDTPKSQMLFGVDVEGLAPAQPATIDERAFGYPLRSLSLLKPGEYTVQAVLHRYETFHRSDGFTVKLPMDRGEGQHWNLAPGNLYSKPQKIVVRSAADAPVRVVLDQQIPQIAAPKDTK